MARRGYGTKLLNGPERPEDPEDEEDEANNGVEEDDDDEDGTRSSSHSTIRSCTSGSVKGKGGGKQQRSGGGPFGSQDQQQPNKNNPLARELLRIFPPASEDELKATRYYQILGNGLATFETGRIFKPMNGGGFEEKKVPKNRVKPSLHQQKAPTPIKGGGPCLDEQGRRGLSHGTSKDKSRAKTAAFLASGASGVRQVATGGNGGRDCQTTTDKKKKKSKSSSSRTVFKAAT